MSDLTELYQEVILDHNRNPRNFAEVADASHTAEGFNPLCGDRLTIYLKVKDSVIEDVGFQGSGCAIFKASASVMTTCIKGQTRAEAEACFDRFRNMVMTEDNSEVDIMEFGDMAALSGVSRFPIRVKCATLAWHTFRAALEQKSTSVSTE